LLRAALLGTLLACAAHTIAVGAAAGPVGPCPQAGSADAGDPALSTAERAEVLKGRIVLREVREPGRKGRTFEAFGVLLATVDEALAVITDYRCYPEFMPRVKRTVVMEESPTVALVEQHLKLPLGVDKRCRLRYVIRRGDEGFRVDWEKMPWPGLTPGQTIAETTGYWQVGRFPEGGLLALYHVDTDPGKVPLGMKGLALSFSKREIPKVIEGVRQRLRSIAAPRPGRS